jgi:FtsP/CotA-like multicopper oxidase with cupredoxin domain
MNRATLMSRRSMLFGFIGASLYAALPIPLARSTNSGVIHLKSGLAKIDILGGTYPKTDVWAYAGQVPGPELRFIQGDKLVVAFENNIPQPSTLHWHGIRLPNAMDGVPGLTQAAVDPGNSYLYEFDLLDAGTFWYHPHVNSSEQIARGLYGPIIVEEKSPPKVDRDITWVLDDWRLREDGQIEPSFHQMHDISHSGRMGNVATLNGQNSETFRVLSGERIRLRLINAANARSFSLNFDGHSPHVIALDGQPVKPFEAGRGEISLGSGQRADLIIDMIGKPGEQFTVTDDYYARSPYDFLTLVYEDSKPLRKKPITAPIELKRNPIPVPNSKTTNRNEFVISGGAMGGMRQASFKGGVYQIRDLVKQGKVWAINGVVYDPKNQKPMFTFKKGSSERLVFRNDTAWPHPIHLHGHVFKIVSRNAVKPRRETWSDTILVKSKETVEALFVADNPGDWLLHCHVLEHHEAGMAATIRVA